MVSFPAVAGVDTVVPLVMVVVPGWWTLEKLTCSARLNVFIACQMTP
jgi:hypothetical protein